MIRINLLPYRATRKKENVRNQVVVVIFIIALVLTCMFGVNWVLNGKIQELNVNIANTKQEIGKVEKIAKKVDQLQKEIKTLKKKIAVIKKLKRNRTEPVLFMDAMTKLVVAKKMWITSMQIKGNNVTFNGIALDNKTVADFMTQLENGNRLDEKKLVRKKGESLANWKKRKGMSRWFSSVNLSTVNAKKIQKQNLKSFKISCKKIPLKTPKKAPAKKKK
ncbi:PilN domain-containing protein [Thermodesulfobacteriota bacterium]